MTEDPTILDAMLKTELGNAQGAAQALGKHFTSLFEFLETLEEIAIDSDDRDQIRSELLRAKALAIKPYYDKFSAAVMAVRDLTQED